MPRFGAHACRGHVPRSTISPSGGRLRNHMRQNTRWKRPCASEHEFPVQKPSADVTLHGGTCRGCTCLRVQALCPKVVNRAGTLWDTRRERLLDSERTSNGLSRDTFTIHHINKASARNRQVGKHVGVTNRGLGLGQARRLASCGQELGAGSGQDRRATTRQVTACVVA